jgi:hypothetical protein
MMDRTPARDLMMRVFLGLMLWLDLAAGFVFHNWVPLMTLLLSMSFVFAMLLKVEKEDFMRL